MQTKNQNGKHEITLLPCSDDALFEGNKRGERKGGTKEIDLTSLGAECT